MRLQGGLLVVGVVATYAAAVSAQRRTYTAEARLNVDGVRQEDEVQLLQTLVNVNAPTEPEPKARDPSEASSNFTNHCALVTVAMLLCNLAWLAKLAKDDPAKTAADPAGPVDHHVAMRKAAMEALLPAIFICIDSSVASLTIPMLPELSQGESPSALFFARPIVATTTAMLLPLMLRGGVHRGRLATALGLMMISLSCLIFGTVPSFAAAMVARIVGAAASAAIFVPLLHTVMLQAPIEHKGWRLCVALCGAAAGSSFGPWVGHHLYHACGLSPMMVVLALVAAMSCFVQILETRRIAEEGNVACVVDQCSISSVVQASSDFANSAKHLVLLVGLLLGAAVLALHSMLVPLYLGTMDTFADPQDLNMAEGAASLAFGLAILSAGLFVDGLGEQLAVRGAVVALVMNVLGLRAIAENPTHLWIAMLGLVASNWGLGMYFGLAVPALVRALREEGCSVTVVATSAVTSAFVAIALFTGDAFGVVLQRMLYPLLGYRDTITLFLLGVGLTATTMFGVTAMDQRVTTGKAKGSELLKEKLQQAVEQETADLIRDQGAQQ
eukprot:gnl/TRDRNA2_/TRDRNA2_46119_c0_seq1.p1 gnl/TRDRNA2_/TRDRNA2_46119_c0~~gnl/TRDRNA2_/TRDRNA2_46119_c0_seq1.p1  ORF type:complete len:556 (+),score=121.31 gnl/TRDRNA2_/TRDRNA2_46119_c0_seq1:54-1721(+)